MSLSGRGRGTAVRNEEPAAEEQAPPQPQEPQEQPARERPAERAPRTLRVISDWCWRLLIVAAALGVAFWLIDQVRLVAISFVVGILVTALLHPFVALLARNHVPRLLATALVFVLGLAALGGVGYFIGVQVSSNAAALGQQFTDIINSAQRWISTGPFHIQSGGLNQLTNQLTDGLNRNWQQIATGAISGIGTGVELLGGMLLAAFCTFFLLLDGGEMWSWFTGKFTSRAGARLRDGGVVAWRTLSHYVRGTVVIAFTDAVAVTITLLVAQVPLALPVGVLVFLGAFIPVLGLLVTGALAVLLALVSQGLIVAVVVLVVIVLAVQFEGHVLQPVVMSRAVRVHPLAVLLSVTAGSLVAGIFGAVIAVPLVAVVNNVLTQRRPEVERVQPRLPRRRPPTPAA